MSEQNEFEKLWSILPHPEGSVVRWMARREGSIRGDFATSAKELEQVAASLPDWQVYVAVNPTEQRLGIRHSSEDVTHWSFFLLDIDPICLNPAEHGANCDICWRSARPREALNRAIFWLGRMLWVNFLEYPPTIIDSGRGMQAWIRLDDIPMHETMPLFAGAYAFEPYQRIDGVCTLVGGTRSQARKVMGYWLKQLDEFLGESYGCRLDTSCSDLPRVMRMPGTVNQKTGRTAEVVSIGPRRLGFATRMLDDTPKEVLFQPEIVPASEGSPWWSVFQKLTPDARMFIMEGGAETTRHRISWHLAKSLWEYGISYEQAWEALQLGNSRSSKPLEIEELRRQLNCGYGI